MKKEGMNSYSDTVNELLARYGVRFGIYKNGTFKEQLFPFDMIPERSDKRSSNIWKKALTNALWL